MASLQIKISKTTKKTLVTKSEFTCDFCNKSFQREMTMMKHICEPKRRWQDKDLVGNRIGFQTWLEFYTKNSTSKKKRTYIDFTKSAYYLVFVRFANYCVSIKAVNIIRYTNWLINNKVKIDSWSSDTVYNRFLIEYLKDEDPFDAIARSIENTIELAKEAGIETKDCLRYINRNRLVNYIINGKISPWMLYHSESGIELIEDLDESQQRIIMDYINPERWAVKFKRDSDIVRQVKELLKSGGY
jgi:hypothetical protein